MERRRIILTIDFGGRPRLTDTAIITAGLQWKLYFESAFEPPDAWLNAATSRRLCSASFSSTLCT